MPAVTVVMTHYEKDAYIYDAVESVLTQTYSDLQLIVLDDCSGSTRWIEAISEFSSDRRLRIFSASTNVGTYRLKNAILEGIDSKYVAFHDCDDISSKERIQRQIDCIRSGRLDMVGTAYREFRNEKFDGIECIMPRYPKLHWRLGRRFVSLHPTWLADRRIFDELKGFDGEARFGADDEFLYRAMLLFKVRNMRSCLYYKREHKESLTGSPITGYKSKPRMDYQCSIDRRMAFLRHKMGPLLRVGLEANPNNISFTLKQLNI